MAGKSRSEALSLYKRHGHVHQREGQALMLHPLLAEERHERDAYQKKGHQKAKPPEKRHDPRRPGDGLARRQAVEEPGDGVACVVGCDPIRDVVPEKIGPFVFRGGIVVRRRQDGDQEHDQAHIRHHRDQRHDEDDDELRGAERPGGVGELQSHVDHENRGEEQEHRKHREIAETQPVNVVRLDEVRVQDPAAPRGQDAERHCPERETGGAQALGMLGLDGLFGGWGWALRGHRTLSRKVAIRRRSWTLWTTGERM